MTAHATDGGPVRGLTAYRAQLAALDEARHEETAHLLALRQRHVEAIRRIDWALSALNADRSARETGTYAMLARYIREGWDGKADITPSVAAEWMLARGWITAGTGKARIVAAALAKWAAEDPPRLVRVRHGAYRPPGR